MGELKIGINYKHRGETLSAFPGKTRILIKDAKFTRVAGSNKMLLCFLASLEVQKHMEVEYITMPGWTEDIANVRKFEDLPEAAQNYVRAVEKYTGLPGEKGI